MSRETIFQEVSAERDDDQLIQDEFSAMIDMKDPRPMIDAPCPDCFQIGEFLVNADGSRWPERCIPCQEARAINSIEAIDRQAATKEGQSNE